MSAVYEVSLNPHMRSSKSIREIYWKLSAVLLLPVIAGIVFFHLQAVRILLFSILSFFSGEWLSGHLLKIKPQISSGQPVLSALIFTLLIPLNSKPEAVILSGLLASLLISGFFGGLGHSIFHPALMGIIFLNSIFGVSQAGSLSMVDSHVLLMIACSLILLFLKGIRTDLPLIFLGSLALVSIPLNPASPVEVLNSRMIFSAIFLLADPVYLPVSIHGKRWFALASAVLIGVLNGPSGSIAGLCSCFLILNALTGFFDAKGKPKPVLNPFLKAAKA